MKYIDRLKYNWDAFAESDPMWAILCYQEKMGNRWRLAEFMETGVVFNDPPAFLALSKTDPKTCEFIYRK